MDTEKKIPLWIMIYGGIQALIALYFGIRFLIDGDLSESFNPAWFLGARNLAIVSVLAFGLIARIPAFIFAGFQLRFVVDFFDVINEVIAADAATQALLTASVFIFLSLIPLAWGMRVLWRIMKS